MTLRRRVALLLAAAPLACAAAAPSLTVLAPGPDSVAGRGSFLVSWRAEGGDTVLVRMSADGGVTWKDLVARPAPEGFYLGDASVLPEGVPLRLRLLLRDGTGKVLVEADAPAPLVVDRTPPTATVAGPETSSSARVAVVVHASDGKGSGVASVSLWATEDDRTWVVVAESADPSKPVPWTAPHRGRWGLFATAMDRAANAGALPGAGTAPQQRILVRTPEPWIARFAAETTDYIVPGGYALPLAWTVEGEELPEGPVTIEARGTGASWIPVGRNLPAKGRTTWRLPARTGPLPELRLRAAGLHGASVRELQPALMVDASPPRVSLEGPRLWEKPGPAEIQASVFDDLSGVAGVSLWWKDPQGGAWLGPKRAESGRSLALKEQDGRYGLWISAVDALGNASPPPGPRDKPMLELLIDREPPAVSLLSPRGGEVAQPGRGLQVSWSATDANLPPRAVALFASRDGGGGWELLKDSLPNDGELACPVPPSPGPLWLRITALDAAGHLGEAVLSRPVTVAAVSRPVEPAPPPPPPPVSVPALTGLPKEGVVAGGRPLALGWAVPRDAGDLTVLVSASADGGGHWEPVGSAPASDGRLSWQVPALDCPALRLRLSLLKGERLLGSSETADFSVASRPPKVSLVPPPGQSPPPEDP